MITEIEATLNTRPLTYQGAAQEEISMIRPIDFLQHKLNLTLPLQNLSESARSDPEYISPGDARTMQTRHQAEEALRSSCQFTERFWKIWHHQYLASLRETHKKYTINRRQGRDIPKVGDVILVSDSVLPRNEWKMARILDTRESTNGMMREVELQTASKRKIRRP
ncbi:hypothetical protein ANCCAN_04649 [Ancylostoma caninum]|uniref:DUF5641 domain-containing protein n=1 Tax=Ancylostoma caninum TaxID=29170 RepID=A0A368GY19_ANCCA|nr:hypothetical protein ANCCAN_04649 [Ancylostoma caninum]